MSFVHAISNRIKLLLTGHHDLTVTYTCKLYKRTSYFDFYLFCFFLAYYKALHQSSCFPQKVEIAGWCNDYGTVRVLRSIAVVIMKALSLSPSPSLSE
jgi:hypothetical protein